MCLRVLPRIALLLFVLSMFWVCFPAGASAADGGASSVLFLNDGGYLPGELHGSDDPKVLRWRSPCFAQPFEFPMTAVKAVQYPAPGPQPKPVGEYCFELVNDDVLYGNVLRWTGDEVALESVRIGRVHLRREQIRRFYLWKGADAIYLGPNGLAGWTDSAATPHWRDEGGQLVTDQPGASLYGALGIPEKAMIEVELSWKGAPDFVLALGVEDREAAVSNAFHLEVWDGELVVVGESARDADVASIQPVGTGEGHVRLQIYLDQAQQRLHLLSRGGKPLATLHVDAKNGPIHPGVRLTNKKGDVRLEHLRITSWNGLPPREIREEQSRLHRTDGSIVYGQITGFDPDSKQFTFRDGKTETRIEQAAILDVFLAPSVAVAKAPADTAAGSPKGTVRAVYRDGWRISGTLTRIEDTHLTLNSPGVKEPLRLPLAGLRSLIALNSPGGTASIPAVAGRAGRMEMEGVHLNGRLVKGTEQPDGSCLVWHPELALNASPLLPGESGRIVYRDPPQPKPSVPEGQRTVIMQGGARVILNAQPVAPPVAKPAAPRRLETTGRTVPARSTGWRLLHLRSGDTIPCTIDGIDEKGVTFRTPISDATFVAHEKIKAIQLVANTSPRLEDPKRDRLLTLPRMQKDSPPTHLICSTNGDFLRGRVREMDDTRLKVEVRLETRVIPRNRVAQIIWLHADEWTAPKDDRTVADRSRTKRVQTLRADGNRLTFVAEKADEKTISGTSDVLGACRADLAEVDQVLFGTSIEESAARLAFHLWKLHPAAEPKFAQADPDAADGRLTGKESALVGQPAYGFSLDTLNGQKFQLASAKGRVVVLEFWATWCGPCLETMPLVDSVVKEFADRGVELLAVNLEEQPETVKATLERHKLKLPVAFDRDGVIAAKYTVTAIPQTVVIDRDGKVARLFVGGGKKTAEALRAALQELSAGKPMPATPP